MIFVPNEQNVARQVAECMAMPDPYEHVRTKAVALLSVVARHAGRGGDPSIFTQQIVDAEAIRAEVWRLTDTSGKAAA